MFTQVNLLISKETFKTTINNKNDNTILHVISMVVLNNIYILKIIQITKT